MEKGNKPSQYNEIQRLRVLIDSKADIDTTKMLGVEKLTKAIKLINEVLELLKK